jgi:chemotaxis protein MotB
MIAAPIGAHMHSTDDLLESERAHRPRARPLPWVLLALALLAGTAVTLVLARRLADARALALALTEKVQEEQRDGSLRVAQGRDAAALLEAKLARLERENSELQVHESELATTVKSKDDELRRLEATAAELEEKMKAEIGKGEIQLSQAGGRLRVALVDKILFDSGDAKISRRGEEVLGRVGAVLARAADKQIQVAGHTDDSPISARLAGRYTTNWELSTARATNVVRFLQEKARVPPRRLAASGYGEFHPVASNATPAGRARNRRIEILLAPEIDPVPSKAELAATAKPARPAPVKIARAKIAKGGKRR